MSEPTPETVVSECVNGHALADKNLAKAYRNQERMLKAVEEGLGLGMIADGMAAKQFIWGHRVALGKIAEAALALANLHPTGTAFAKANGADLGKITNAGGIDLPQPEFTVMSGGDR